MLVSYSSTLTHVARYVNTNTKIFLCTEQEVYCKYTHITNTRSLADQIFCEGEEG